MKSLYLKSGNIQDVFNELKELLKGTLVSDKGEHNLALDSTFVKGKIEGVAFPEGMTYLQFDLIFTDDVMLSIESLNNSPIFFAYCFDGSLKHSVGAQGDKKSLKKQHSGILKNTSKTNSILYFEKNIPLKFSIIGIGTTVTGDSTNDITNDILINKIKHTFFDKEENLMHVQLQNLKIAEKIEEFNAVKQKGIIRNLLKKEILHIVLEMEIEQHIDSFTKMSETITSLTLKQMDEIKRVSKFIMNLQAEEFTFQFLTQKIALSSNKLQERFKMMHNKTINNFVTLRRMELNKF